MANTVDAHCGKGLLCHMQTANVQISMRIRTVWSDQSLFVDIYYSIHWFCRRTTKAPISLRIRAGWSGPALFANCSRALFVRCTLIHKVMKCLMSWATGDCSFAQYDPSLRWGSVGGQGFRWTEISWNIVAELTSVGAHFTLTTSVQCVPPCF